MKISNSERKLNNKGFSLLELIITIAIMLIMVGAATVTVSMLDSSYVEDAERGIKDYISMARTKSMTVAAKDWYVSISKEGNTYYAYLNKIEEVAAAGGAGGTVDNHVQVDKIELGAKLSIKFGVDKTSMTTIDAASVLELHFDSATGKIKNVVLNGNPQSITGGIGYISITRNDYKISLKVFMNTGKCERE
ncbi:MAG: prepilin-type N-terminal cleavage/methylation domain-containing protein [Lachnospiraceae bacterium]|nr:prepilin-type N-terminal cleavage/methylation domain-containing protein [Lachnospiraceae bacterium]